MQVSETVRRRTADGASLIVLLCTFVPFSPEMPLNVGDGHWMYALGEAVRQKLTFGTDVIFTFGPLSGLYSGVYHPSTSTLTMVMGAFLAASYWYCGRVICGQRSWPLLVFSLYLSSAVGVIPDAAFMAYPLMAIVAVDTRALEKPVAVGLVTSPIGILVAIKGTFAVLGVFAIVLIMTSLMMRRKVPAGLASMAAPVTALVLVWVAFLQPISAIPAFMASTVMMTQGYADAMALKPGYSSIAVYLATAALVVGYAALATAGNLLSRLLRLSAIVSFLFLAFKAGFIRAGIRDLIAADALVIGAALLCWWTRTAKAGVVVLVLAIVASIFIYDTQFLSPLDRARYATERIQRGLGGASKSISDPTWKQRAHDERMIEMKLKLQLSLHEATADILSYGQLDLLAADGTWAPRPIMHSYAAYTPALAALNRNHILGQSGPERLIVRLEPIDGRFPTLEDGPTLRDAGSTYVLSKGIANDVVELSRTPKASPEAWHLDRTVQATLGQAVAIPADHRAYAVSMMFSPSPVGRLLGLLFRRNELRIRLILNDGSRRSFKLVAGMAEAGFILSPFFADAGSLASCLYASPQRCDGPRVVQFSVVEVGPMPACWTSAYTVTTQVQELP